MSATQLWRWGRRGGSKNASKSDSQSGLSRMESVCAGEGFYQRLTLTGIPVWDCPSNSCVPQEAVHKKQPKTPEDISYVASRLTGSTKTQSHGFLFHSSSESLLKTPAPWKNPPIIGRHGGVCLWPPLKLRARTHLITQNSQGKFILFFCCFIVIIILK